MKLKEASLAEDLAEQMAEVHALYCPPAKLSVCLCEEWGRRKLNWITLYTKHKKYTILTPECIARFSHYCMLLHNYSYNYMYMLFKQLVLSIKIHLNNNLDCVPNMLQGASQI